MGRIAVVVAYAMTCSRYPRSAGKSPRDGRARSSTVGLPNQMHSWVKMMIWRRGARMVIGRRDTVQHYAAPTGTRAPLGGMLESFLAGPGSNKTRGPADTQPRPRGRISTRDHGE